MMFNHLASSRVVSVTSDCCDRNREHQCYNAYSGIVLSLSLLTDAGV
jgi:hypothetical protein